MAVHGRRASVALELVVRQHLLTGCGPGSGGNAPRITTTTPEQHQPGRDDDQKNAAHRGGHRLPLRVAGGRLGLPRRPRVLASAAMTRNTALKETVPLPDALAGRSIVLVGLMGAGKTSIGRRLAARLGLPFRDADAEIELAAGCTIPELFARYGEPRVPRRRAAGDPPAAGGRADGAGDRRRRVHGPGHARAVRERGGLRLAALQAADPGAPGRRARQPAAAHEGRPGGDPASG